MCEGKKCCERPQELKGDPAKCPPEQVRKCHGDVKRHPCLPGRGSKDGGAK